MADGEGVDPRDERAMRFSMLNMLMDWSGEDMQNIYAPLTDQIGFIFTALLAILCIYIVWKVQKKWKEAAKPPFKPYKVIKPPTRVIVEAEKGVKQKRIVAVLGGTGFVGSHVVNELVKRKEYYVYVLGRTFRKERMNPDADALIQVDLKDLDGLERALQGVDSVINAAAIIPTVFTSAQDVWQSNRFGMENIILACKKAKVKNFVFLCALHIEGRLKSPGMKAFLDVFEWCEKHVCESDTDDLHTCVVSPGNIIGLNQPFLDGLFSGKMRSSPSSDSRISFSPVSYVARALVNAEVKLVEGADGVCGKILPLIGERMSWNEFLQLPTWPHKISKMPAWQLKALARFNFICAKLFGWAPFGAEVAPGVEDFMNVTEAKYENFEEVYAVLDIGPPAPPMEEYIKELVEKCKEKDTK